MEYLPTIRQLQYLSALAEHKTFSKAAEICHVTQSTLSAGIRELETLLNHRLVDRSRRQAILTPLGETVLGHGRIILAEAGEIIASARALSRPLSGPLRLGIIPTIAPYLLPEILPALQKQFPFLSLRLDEDQSARLIEKAKTGALDVLLLAFPYETPGLTQILLFEEPFYVACPKGSWQGHRPARLSDLEGTALLLLEEGHCLRDHALAACRFRAEPVRKTFSATSLATLIQFVQHGYGMTILPEMAAGHGMLPGHIEVIPFAPPVPTRKIGLAFRKNHPQEKEFRMLAEALKSRLSG